MDNIIISYNLYLSYSWDFIINDDWNLYNTTTTYCVMVTGLHKTTEININQFEFIDNFYLLAGRTPKMCNYGTQLNIKTLLYTLWIIKYKVHCTTWYRRSFLINNFLRRDKDEERGGGLLFSTIFRNLIVAAHYTNSAVTIFIMLLFFKLNQHMYHDLIQFPFQVWHTSKNNHPTKKKGTSQHPIRYAGYDVLL